MQWRLRGRLMDMEISSNPIEALVQTGNYCEQLAKLLDHELRGLLDTVPMPEPDTELRRAYSEHVETVRRIQADLSRLGGAVSYMVRDGSQMTKPEEIATDKDS